MNFYEQTSSCVSRLSPTEQNLFNYIIKNLHIVKDMSIRDLSEKCFVSTTSKDPYAEHRLRRQLPRQLSEKCD